MIQSYGGKGGIRTPGGLTPSAVFKTAAFGRSATFPYFRSSKRFHACPAAPDAAKPVRTRDNENNSKKLPVQAAAVFTRYQPGLSDRSKPPCTRPISRQIRIVVWNRAPRQLVYGMSSGTSFGQLPPVTPLERAYVGLFYLPAGQARGQDPSYPASYFSNSSTLPRTMRMVFTSVFLSRIRL